MEQQKWLAWRTRRSRAALGKSGARILLLTGLFALPACHAQKKIWIYTSLYKEVVHDLRAPMQSGLGDTSVELRWFQNGSENIASKLSTEIMAGRARGDLLLTSDPFYYLELKEAGKLLRYESPAAKGIDPRWADPDFAFVGVRLPVMVIGYNSRLIAEKDAPKSWKQLLLPRWKGKLAMPSPLESGTAFTTVALLSRAYSWEFFKALRAQEILASGGNSSVLSRIETGERPVGILLLENILKAQGKGSVIRPIYPEDGAVPILSPIAILKDTSQPELAKRAYDRFFGADAQNAIIQSGMYSLLPTIPAPPRGKPLLEVKFVPWSASILKELYGERETIKSRFTELVLH